MTCQCSTPSDVDRLVTVMRALGDPTRLAILQAIACECSDECECRVCQRDICSGLDVSQPTVAHHLRKLEEAGVVERTREGREVRYRVDATTIEEVRQWLRHIV